MPFVRCVYSGCRSDVEDSLGRELSRVIASAINKPESRVFIQVEHCTKLLFGGSQSPCAMVQIDSIGGSLTELCQLITSLIHRMTGISNDRIFMNFHDFHRDCFGRNGKTLDNTVKIKCYAKSKPKLLAKL